MTALLRIDKLNKRFGGLQAIGNVNLSLHSGQVTTLVGPNGAGKTTLFNMITGHIPPTSGDIHWQDQRITGQKPWKIARLGIARTFQDLRLFGQMTVFENVLTVLERGTWLWQAGAAERRERVEAILVQTGLADRQGARAMDLAYAERKFLSMARILAARAALWLLDEPASGLDPRSFERFVALLRDVAASGVTICIIEHNLDIVTQLSDRVVFLDQGRLLAEGTATEVLSDPHLASIYFGERT